MISLPRATRRGLGAVVGFCLFFAIAAAATFAQVGVEVVTDRYVLPIAELASTQTNPDVIVLSNERVHLSLIPNRGRVIAELRSAEGTEFLAFEDEPDPFKGVDGVDAVEFGGFYASVPWNMRVRQPYNLNYEIVQDGSAEAEVAITGQDILTRVAVVWRVTLEQDSNAVDVTATYTNESSRRAQTIDLANIVHLSREGEGRVRRIFLGSFEDVEVISSENDWLGAPESSVSAREIRRDWRTDGSYCVNASVDPEGDAVAWFDRGSREALRWEWGPTAGFSRVVLCGRPEFVRLELHSPTFTLEPGETKSLSQRFILADGLRRNPSLEETAE